MTAITFDTLRFVRKLKEAGFEEKQAEAVADAFRGAQAETETATRHDLKELELSFKGRHANASWRYAGDGVPYDR